MLRFPRLPLLLVAMMLVGACSRHPKWAREPEWAAVRYVEMLQRGEYDAVVRSMLSCQDIDADYRELRLRLLRQMMEELPQDSRPSAVEATKAELQDSGRVAHVFLKLTFADGRKENVVLPLCRHDGRWLLW